MKCLYDVQQLLKRYGIFVYVGNRLYDIELMSVELKNLYRAHLLSEKVFQSASLVLQREHSEELKRQKKKTQIAATEAKQAGSVEEEAK